MLIHGNTVYAATARNDIVILNVWGIQMYYDQNLNVVIFILEWSNHLLKNFTNL